MEVRCLNDEGTVESWLPARVLAPADNRGNYCIRLLGEDDTENRNDGDAPANAYNMEASELRPLFDPTESSGAANYVSSGDAAVEGLRVDCCMMPLLHAITPIPPQHPLISFSHLSISFFGQGTRKVANGCLPSWMAVMRLILPW